MKQPTIYQYDILPAVFRRQVIYIWMSAIGPYAALEDHSSLNILRNPPPASNAIWIHIFSTLARELGMFALGDKDANPFVQCQQYLLNTDTNGALDIIDLSFHVIDRNIRRLSFDDIRYSKITQTPDDAIEELNVRFQEHGIGYQFKMRKLVKIVAQYTHEPIIQPVISLPTFHCLLDLIDKSYGSW